MSFDDEIIMAYVDGECDLVTAKRIEKAMETESELFGRIEKGRALKDKLVANYEPMAQGPVPDRLTALLSKSINDNVDTSFANRQVEQERRKELRRGFGFAQWGAMAATLVIGVAVGQFGLGQDSDPFSQQGGALIARGSLENALEKQLASAQTIKDEFRIGLTFRAKSGDICRSFNGEAVSGIACRENEQWQTHTALPGGTASDYRQASSGEINAIVSEMMADAPLDADAERKLLGNGWK